jgi:hypothetical protein
VAASFSLVTLNCITCDVKLAFEIHNCTQWPPSALFFIQGTLEYDKKEIWVIFVTPIETITTSEYMFI